MSAPQCILPILIYIPVSVVVGAVCLFLKYISRYKYGTVQHWHWLLLSSTGLSVAVLQSHS